MPSKFCTSLYIQCLLRFPSHSCRHRNTQVLKHHKYKSMLLKGKTTIVSLCSWSRWVFPLSTPVYCNSICTQHYSPLKQLFQDHVTFSMFLAMFYELPLCSPAQNPGKSDSAPVIFAVCEVWTLKHQACRALSPSCFMSRRNCLITRKVRKLNEISFSTPVLFLIS